MDQPPTKKRKFLRRLRELSRRQKDASEKRRSEYLYLNNDKCWRRLFINLHPESLFSYFTSRAGLWLLAQIGLVAFCLLTLLVTFAYFHYRSEVPATILELQSCLEAQVIDFYDQEGKTLLWSAHEGHECRRVALDEVNPYVIDALISIEDKDFFQHPGIKITSIARSVINNLLGRPLQGGSTITQQYLKNAILKDSTRSWERKIKEMVLIPEIESLYSKDEILIAYLNTIYLGSNYSGIEAAAEGYFGHSAAELTLDEAAYLVASINSPSTIWDDQEYHLRRRNLVLSEMLEDGKIKRAKYEAALAVDTSSKLREESEMEQEKDIKHAPYFVLEARRQLEELLCELDENACDGLPTKNYKVITSLNLAAQNILDQTVSETIEELESNYDNAALIVINNQNKQVMALSGGRDFQNPDFGQINNITLQRVPGDLWHPIIYAALMKDNPLWSGERILYDYPTFTLESDLEFQGPVSLRRALAQSIITPTVKAAHLADYDKINDFAANLHLDHLDNCQTRCDLEQTQASNFTVRLDNLANAYGSLASGGRHRRLSYIQKVTDDDQRMIYNRPDNSWQATGAETAFIINDILADEDFQPKAFADYGNLAFKADFSDDFRSNPFIAYTPSLTLGGWIGQQIHLEEEPPEEDARRGQSMLVTNFFQNWQNPHILAEAWQKPTSLQVRQTHPVSGHLINSAGQTGYYSSRFKEEDLPLPAIISIDKVSGHLATECTPMLALKELTSSALVPELNSKHPSYQRWMTPIWQNLASRLDNRIPNQIDNLHSCNDRLPDLTITQKGDCSQNCQLIIKAQAGSHDLQSITISAESEDFFEVFRPISGQKAEITYEHVARTTDATRLKIELLDRALYQKQEFFDL